MTTPREATDRAGNEPGWIALLAVTSSRAYLIALATLGAIVVLPSLLGWTPSVVQSESMKPHVSTGDIVLASDLPDTSPLPIGAVITFRVDERTIVHRLVSVNDDNTLVTAGDANPQLDPWSAGRDDVTGEARLLVPYVGLPGLWLQRGDLVPLIGWLALTLAALVMAVPGVRAQRASRHRRGRDRHPPAVPITAGVAAVLSVVLIAAPIAPADAAFSASTRTTSSWKTQAYSPITVGAMSGFGAIAYNSIQDTSTSSYQSTIAGNAALTPGFVTSGFRDADIVTVHANDQAATGAMSAAWAARGAIAQRPVTRTLPAALSGTLTGGVYGSTTGAFSVASSLTLDARGDSTARFVFFTSTTLTMAQRSRIVLANGAQAANVWWIVGTTATLGTLTSGTPNVTAVGNYIANGNVALRGVTLSGRAVSTSGSVQLNGRIVPVG